MKNYNKLLLLLAFLLVGNVNLRADGNDPFPEVNTYQYADNMCIIAKARLDGVELGAGTIVAVYHGDEIRGKATPLDQGPYTNIFFLTIWGETKGQALTFKVYSDGNIYTVNQGLTFTINDWVGDMDDPYYIDVTSSTVGDVTGNGNVNDDDVSALVDIVLGRDNALPHQYDHDAADVNNDGKVSLADITALTNLLKNKP